MAMTFAIYELGAAVDPDTLLVGTTIDGVAGNFVKVASSDTRIGVDHGPSGELEGTYSPLGEGSILYTGRVTDTNGNPIEGVGVWAKNLEDEVVAGTVFTNADGYFEMMLDAGTYKLFQAAVTHNFTNPTTFTVA